ncbi:MAG: hypothetical protein M3Y23_06635, partial [Actinomycetota bacterium]|nr:hypothetical protein [Actinomycetota bacterium]
WGKSDRGECKSKLASGRVPICCFARGTTSWRLAAPSKREVIFDSYDPTEIGKPPINGPNILGWVSDHRSAKFFVDSFSVPGFVEDPKSFWYTPEIRDAQPGSQGGPLYLNWDAGMDNSFDAYLHGYLYKYKK